MCHKSVDYIFASELTTVRVFFSSQDVNMAEFLFLLAVLVYHVIVIISESCLC